MAKPKQANSTLETVEPIGDRVLVRKDQDRKVTKEGIHLPDKIEIRLSPAGSWPSVPRSRRM